MYHFCYTPCSTSARTLEYCLIYLVYYYIFVKKIFNTVNINVNCPICFRSQYSHVFMFNSFGFSCRCKSACYEYDDHRRICKSIKHKCQFLLYILVLSIPWSHLQRVAPRVVATDRRRVTRIHFTARTPYQPVYGIQISNLTAFGNRERKPSLCHLHQPQRYGCISYPVKFLT